MELHNAYHRWFIHTAASAPEYPDVVGGTEVLPSEQRELVLETALTFPAGPSREMPQSPDVVMVKVCTLGEPYVGSTELHAHNFYRGAKDALGDYRAVVDGDTTGLPTGHPLKCLELIQPLGEALLRPAPRAGAFPRRADAHGQPPVF